MKGRKMMKVYCIKQTLKKLNMSECTNDHKFRDGAVTVRLANQPR